MLSSKKKQYIFILAEPTMLFLKKSQLWYNKAFYPIISILPSLELFMFSSIWVCLRWWQPPWESFQRNRHEENILQLSWPKRQCHGHCEANFKFSFSLNTSKLHGQTLLVADPPLMKLHQNKKFKLLINCGNFFAK